MGSIHSASITMVLETIMCSLVHCNAVAAKDAWIVTFSTFFVWVLSFVTGTKSKTGLVFDWSKIDEYLASLVVSSASYKAQNKLSLSDDNISYYFPNVFREIEDNMYNTRVVRVVERGMPIKIYEECLDKRLINKFIKRRAHPPRVTTSLTSKNTHDCYVRVYYIGSIKDGTTEERVVMGLHTGQLVWAWTAMSLISFYGILMIFYHEIRSEVIPVGHYAFIPMKQWYSAFSIFFSVAIVGCRILILSVCGIPCSPSTFPQMVRTGLTQRGARTRIVAEGLIYTFGCAGIILHCFFDFCFGGCITKSEEYDEAAGSVALGQVVGYESSVAKGKTPMSMKWYNTCNALYLFGSDGTGVEKLCTEFSNILHSIERNDNNTQCLKFMSIKDPASSYTDSIIYHNCGTGNMMIIRTVRIIAVHLKSQADNEKKNITAIKKNKSKKIERARREHGDIESQKIETIEYIKSVSKEEIRMTKASINMLLRKSQLLMSSTQMLGYMWESTKHKSNLQYKMELRSDVMEHYEECIKNILRDERYTCNGYDIIVKRLQKNNTMEDSLLLLWAYIRFFNYK